MTNPKARAMTDRTNERAADLARDISWLDAQRYDSSLKGKAYRMHSARIDRLLAALSPTLEGRATSHRVGDFIGGQPVLCDHGHTDWNNHCPLCEAGIPTPQPARADIGHTADELPKVLAARDAEFEARLADLTIAPDTSTLHDLAWSISGALQDCPAMSIDKQAEFVARALWPAIQPARAEREEIGKLQAQARTLFLHDAHDGAATAYGPLSHDMLIQMIVERNVILKKLLALRPQPAPVQAVVKDHLTTESPATRTSTHMKGKG